MSQSSDSTQKKSSPSEIDKLEKENLELQTKMKTLCAILADAGLQLQVLANNFKNPNSPKTI